MTDYSKIRQLNTEAFDYGGNLVLTGDVLSEIKQFQAKNRKLERQFKQLEAGIDTNKFLIEHGVAALINKLKAELERYKEIVDYTHSIQDERTEVLAENKQLRD